MEKVKKTFFTAKNIATMGVLMALVVVLQVFAGSINIANLVTLNFSLIPIVLGAIVLGPVAGAILGWTYSPLVTTLICLVKTTVAGFAGGMVFRVISKKNTLAATFVASALVPIINTSLFVLGCLCMSDTILTYQNTLPQSQGMNIFIFICVGLVTFNFFIELALNLIVSPALNSVYRVVEKQFIHNKKRAVKAENGTKKDDAERTDHDNLS